MVNKSASYNEGVLTTTTISVVVVIIIIGIVLVPIVNAMTTTTETIDVPGDENPDPIGDLRLIYSEDGSLDLSFEVALSEGEVSITGDYEIAGLTGGIILFGSDNYSLILSDGALIESVNGNSISVESATITITGGEINGVAYTFLYYPSSEGTYANYQSWEYNIGPSYAVGNFAGVTIQSKDGTVTDSNPYGFTAEVQTEDGITTGVNYNIPSGGE